MKRMSGLTKGGPERPLASHVMLEYGKKMLEYGKKMLLETRKQGLTRH